MIRETQTLGHGVTTVKASGDTARSGYTGRFYEWSKQKGPWRARRLDSANVDSSEENNFSESLALNEFECFDQLKPREAQFQKTARSAVCFLRRQPQNFENLTLVARRREHFRVFLTIFLVPQLPPKRVLLVHKITLASCQRCRHSVEPRALK